MQILAFFACQLTPSPPQTMNLPFAPQSAEHAEYIATMDAITGVMVASAPDPQPEDLGQWDISEEEAAYWEDRAEMNDYDPEDRYLDSSWEDRAEMGCDFGDY